MGPPLALFRRLQATGRSPSAALLDSSERTTLALVGRAPTGRSDGSKQSRHARGLELLGSWRRGHIFVQLSRCCLRNVAIGNCSHDDLLAATERSRNRHGISWANLAMRLGGLFVHVDLATFAGLLRLGSRPEKARDIEPDVETKRLERFTVHGSRSRSRFFGLTYLHSSRRPTCSSIPRSTGASERDRRIDSGVWRGVARRCSRPALLLRWHKAKPNAVSRTPDVSVEL
jgi:hypothetical protein